MDNTQLQFWWLCWNIMGNKSDKCLKQTKKAHTISYSFCRTNILKFEFGGCAGKCISNKRNQFILIEKKMH